MFRFHLLTTLLLSLALSGVAVAQDPAGDTGDEARLEAAYQKVIDAGKFSYDRSRLRDPEYRKEIMAKRAAAFEAQKKAAEAFLTNEAEHLDKGVGLFYRGRALIVLGKQSEAAEPLSRFRKEMPDHPDRPAAGIELLRCLEYGTNDLAAAKALIAELKKEPLSGQQLSFVEREEKGLPAWEKRESLKGKPLPEIPVEDTIGAPADFTFDGLKGKVVVIDFWATWCGPCRAIIPGLVKLQAKHAEDGLQVIGLTTFYGSGWKLTGREGDRLIGNSVGSRQEPLDRAAEKEVNEVFHRGLPLNYPIVFTKRATGLNVFGVRGIPTVFVIDRTGIVRYYKMGSTHEEEFHAMVEKLLKEAKP